jgi:pimeloyl-ACP methyl ester carboxylesterase
LKNVTGQGKEPVTAQIAQSNGGAESRFISVDGTNLHFVIKGTGRALILIHGNPGSCQDWTHLYEPLGSRYQVLGFDRPGHGHSERSDRTGPVTVEVQARLLAGALSEFQIDRPILVGHSWGAALALTYALSYPVAGLVLLAPAAYEGDDGVSFLTKLPALPLIGDILNILFTPLVSGWLVRSDLKKAFAPDSVPENYLRHALAEWTSPTRVKWYSIDDALLNESLPKLTPRYPELNVPASILTGDADEIVPPEENALRLQRVLPNSELIVLPNTGHQVLFTQPEAVLRAIDHVAEMSAT